MAMGLAALAFSVFILFEAWGVQATTTIVVGAGMSGIMAAKTLSENGVNDFIILEATDRIGGRMHKKKIGKYTIEIGANWVEGVGGEHVNPIWTLANKYKLRTFRSDWSNLSYNTYQQEGGIYPQSIAAKPFGLAEVRSDWCANLSEHMTSKNMADISILSAQRIYGSVPVTPLDMAIDFYYYDFEIAEPPRVTSLKNVEPIHTFDYYGEDEYFVADPRGYEHVVYRLAKEFLKHIKGKFTDPRLQLNKVVRKVQYSDHGVTVTTEDGSVYSAKNAIVSVSLGVLQTKLIEFKPRLPIWKKIAINKFNMVDYCKIFMKFPSRFWPVGPGTEFFMYAHEKRGYYNFWQHLEKEYPGGNLLMVTVTDDESKRIEQQPESETKAEIMDVLRSMFGAHIPEMEAIIIPKWGQDRFYKGTYSNWAIGASLRDFAEIKAAVGPVYFTGEHTSQQENGYVHGAYLEGISCAKTVLSCLKKKACPKNLTMMHESPYSQQDQELKPFGQKKMVGGRSKRKAQRVEMP